MNKLVLEGFLHLHDEGMHPFSITIGNKASFVYEYGGTRSYQYLYETIIDAFPETGGIPTHPAYGRVRITIERLEG